MSTKNREQKDKKEDIDLDNLSKVWDDYAKIYNKLFATPLFKGMRNQLLNSLISCRGGIIHDGGCGTGSYLKGILEKTQASKIIATDISSEMIKKAKETVSKLPKEYQNKIEFYQMDLTKEWPQEIFDAQIFQQLMNYLPYRGWKKIIEMSYKTMKDGGYIYSGTYLKGFNVKELAKNHTLEQIIKTPPSSYPAMLKSSKILSVFDKLEEKDIIILPTKDEYLEYHKEIGFKNIEITGEFTWGAGIIVRAQK